MFFLYYSERFCQFHIDIQTNTVVKAKRAFLSKKDGAGVIRY